MTDVTGILQAIDAGDPHAAGELLPLVYEELRKLAAAKMAHEKPGQTLDATALVHEAYLRLVSFSPPSMTGGAEGMTGGAAEMARGAAEMTGGAKAMTGGAEDAPRESRGAKWQFANRRHFFAAAAEAMRRILIERARHKRSLKGGGELIRRDLADVEPAAADSDLDLLELDDVLAKLESQDKRKADLVKLRFFVGLTIEEAAQALGISESTANNDWAFARCWLRLEMESANDRAKS